MLGRLAGRPEERERVNELLWCIRTMWESRLRECDERLKRVSEQVRRSLLSAATALEVTYGRCRGYDDLRLRWAVRSGASSLRAGDFVRALEGLLAVHWALQRALDEHDHLAHALYVRVAAGLLGWYGMEYLCPEVSAYSSILGELAWVSNLEYWRVMEEVREKAREYLRENPPPELEEAEKKLGSSFSF